MPQELLALLSIVVTRAFTGEMRQRVRIVLADVCFLHQIVGRRCVYMAVNVYSEVLAASLNHRLAAGCRITTLPACEQHGVPLAVKDESLPSHGNVALVESGQ